MNKLNALWQPKHLTFKVRRLWLPHTLSQKCFLVFHGPSHRSQFNCAKWRDWWVDNPGCHQNLSTIWWVFGVQHREFKCPHRQRETDWLLALWRIRFADETRKTQTRREDTFPSPVILLFLGRSLACISLLLHVSFAWILIRSYMCRNLWKTYSMHWGLLKGKARTTPCKKIIIHSINLNNHFTSRWQWW